MNQVELATPPTVAAEPRPPLPCPYPGLRPFTEHDEAFYFGRDTQRDECIRRLQQHRFLAMVGTSGAGKSSLIRAGVMPAMSRGLVRGADERWRFVVVRPGAEPITSLTREVCKLSQASDTVKVEQEIRSASCGLADAISKLIEKGENVLLVVDQFEELFRLGKERQTPERWHLERVAFVQALLAARSSGIYVVITMRTDFLEDCTFFPDLPEALNSGQYLVPELTREQLEHTIVEPARRLDVTLAPALVRAVLNDAARLRDSLPVVQHALMRTWLHWQKQVDKGLAKPNLIELQHYKDVGTARAALDQHGDQLLEGLGEGAEPVAKLVFQRLTLTNADDKVTRAPTAFDSLVRLAEAKGIDEDALTRVIAVYRDERCRFLMPPPNEDLAFADIDISHEAVFRVWKKLAGEGTVDGWIAEEHENRVMYTRLADSAQLERDKRGQLLDDRHLVFMQGWWDKFRPSVHWASRYHVLDKAGQAIVEGAKAEFLELDRAKTDDKDRKRDEISARYRAALDGWHSAQFESSKSHLDRSVQAKADEVAQYALEERARRKSQVNKWLWVAAAIVLTVAGVLIEQSLKLDGLSREIDDKTKDRDALVKSTKVQVAAAEKQRDDAQRQQVDAQNLQIDAEKKANEAAAREKKENENLLATKDKLATMNKQLADATIARDAANRESKIRQEQIKPLEAKLEAANQQIKALQAKCLGFGQKGGAAD